MKTDRNQWLAQVVVHGAIALALIFASRAFLPVQNPLVRTACFTPLTIYCIWILVVKLWGQRPG